MNVNKTLIFFQNFWYHMYHGGIWLHGRCKLRGLEEKTPAGFRVRSPRHTQENISYLGGITNFEFRFAHEIRLTQLCHK